MEISNLITNKIFVSVVLTWFTSFLIKFIINYKNHGYSTELFIATGGMPSSHAAFTAALTTALYLTEGVSSLFVATLCFTIVIVYDAINLRGKIDKRLEELRKTTKLKTFQEFDPIGHTISQVTAGIVLGIAIPMIIFFATGS